MKLPRDISGSELASLLRGYSYDVSRQTGSHIRLTSKASGKEHHVTVPAHRSLRVGTLSGVLADVVSYLGKTKEQLAEEMFGR